MFEGSSGVPALTVLPAVTPARPPAVQAFMAWFDNSTGAGNPPLDAFIGRPPPATTLRDFESIAKSGARRAMFFSPFSRLCVTVPIALALPAVFITRGVARAIETGRHNFADIALANDIGFIGMCLLSTIPLFMPFLSREMRARRSCRQDFTPYERSMMELGAVHFDGSMRLAESVAHWRGAMVFAGRETAAHRMSLRAFSRALEHARKVPLGPQKGSVMECNLVASMGSESVSQFEELARASPSGTLVFCLIAAHNMLAFERAGELEIEWGKPAQYSQELEMAVLALAFRGNSKVVGWVHQWRDAGEEWAARICKTLDSFSHT